MPNLTYEPSPEVSCPFNLGLCLSTQLIFYARKQLLLQRVLAIAILSVRLSVTRVDQSETVITKSSPSAAWKTVVLGTHKAFL